MDEKVIEDFQFHQETVTHEENSPLHLIREKEMEISGRVLAAKREADEILAEARREAARLLNDAGEGATKEAAKLDKSVKAELEKDSAKVRDEAQKEADELQTAIASRVQSAVDFVLQSVTTV